MSADTRFDRDLTAVLEDLYLGPSPDYRREVIAVALDTGELACRHPRSFAKHRTLTALEHARTLKAQRHERQGRAEPAVEVRSLAIYDQLIA